MLRKISHISFVILLLISTTVMTVNLHFCKQKLYDIGVFSQAENCCMPNEKQHNNTKYHHQCDMNNHKKSDCQDETIRIESIDDFVVSSSNFDFNNLSFLNLFILNSMVADLFNSSNLSVDEIPERNISPPKIQVVLSLLQTYLL